MQAILRPSPPQRVPVCGAYGLTLTTGRSQFGCGIYRLESGVCSVMSNRYGITLDSEWIEWAAKERVSETVAAAVLLICETHALHEVAAKPAPGEFERVIDIVVGRRTTFRLERWPRSKAAAQCSHAGRQPMTSRLIRSPDSVPSAQARTWRASAKPMCSERKFTLGRFDRGGRFFGGFWINLPKVVRLQGLRIDDEDVAGLDYSALNPRLAYYLAEANPPPGDAYTLPGLEQSRDGVKRVFNAMLFKHPVAQFPKGARKLFPSKVKCGEVTDATTARHPMLREFSPRRRRGTSFSFWKARL